MVEKSVDTAEQLKQLIKDYGDDVLRYAYLYLGDRGWSEDVSQQVFLQVYQNIHHYRGDASWRTWILRITINTCKNIRKSKGYRKVMAECSLDALQMDPVEGESLSQEDTALWHEVLLLPDLYRDVVILKYYQDYSNEEIGTLLRLTQSAVRSRLSRAIGKLRESLKGKVDLYESAAQKQLA